ncbi:ankyrin repeat domain-containing protein [Candidatus Palauibacter sp.]|uniref:ankyrin repeat domain-containing protein n=1 Tax=Candidatus Palauibacter sp. TaxID=3101350 RepID=UPI003B011839
MRRDRIMGRGGVMRLPTVGLLVALLTGAHAPDSPVADAAMAGDLARVQALLADGADVSAPQGDGMTALHWAARSLNVPLARLLLEAGADVTATTRIGAYTPLHLASEVGSAEIVGLLLAAGAEQTATTEDVGGAMPLHLAAAAGDAEAVRLLLSHPGEADARERRWGQTPLMYAAARGREEAVRALLEGGADPNTATWVTDITALTEWSQADRRARSARMRGDEEPEVPPQPVPSDRPLVAGNGARAARPVADEEQGYERPIEEPEPLGYGDLIGGHGGMTALLHAAREGHAGTVLALIEGGADVNQVSGGDRTSPMLIAMINGHFDLAMQLLDAGADPTIASAAGATPLFAALNAHWAPKSRYPQQHAYRQQEHSYLDVMRRLLAEGVDPNARLEKHLWWVSYNFDLLQIDLKGATPFWRAAYSLDVDAMKLLVEYGADPGLATIKVPPRRLPAWDREKRDLSGVPPVPVGGPADYPIHAATGIGYGQGFPSNAHRYVPDGWLPAVRYLVEELGADVNQRDEEGYTPLHNAASRGDLEVIRFLVEHGADVTAVSRVGQTTADMANGPYQRTQPFPEAVALLESLGSKNNHNCQSC